MIGYKKDRLLGAWNVVQVVECLLLAYISPKAVNNACCILGPARTVLGRRLSTALYQWVERGKASADSLGVVGNHIPWQLHGGKLGLRDGSQGSCQGPCDAIFQGWMFTLSSKGTKLTPIRRAQASSRLTIDLGVLRPCSGHLFLG